MMNEPPMTNVTPSAPTAAGAPVVVTPTGPPVWRPGGASPARRMSPLVLVLGVVLFALLFYRLTHGANSSERLATDVTRAIANNDMRPVEKEFNAIRRPELENHARVGRLSDFVNEDGALKSVKEDTPSGSAAGYHHFIAHFEKGDREEKMMLDGDGKIAAFKVLPLASQ